MEWRNEILRGISLLPKRGVPGCLVVFGAHAEPVLTGNNEEDLLVAAAELGNGRIVAITHDAYGNKFPEESDGTAAGNEVATFHKNLIEWLLKGDTTNASVFNVCQNADAACLESHKIALYNGGNGLIASNVLLEFIKKGGALLHCITPWGWLQTHKEKMLESDAPYTADILTVAGICYTDGYISVDEVGFSIAANKAEDAHLMRAIEAANIDFDKAVLKVNLLKTLKYIPMSIIDDHFKSSIESQWKHCNAEICKCNVTSCKLDIKCRKDRCMLDLWQLYAQDILQLKNVKAPGVKFFPGDFEVDPPLKCHSMDIHSYTEKEDYHSTGSYAPAGRTISIEVTSGNEEKNWQVVIGAHADRLNKDVLKRWPNICVKVKLNEKLIKLSSPFGGSIYIISPNKQNSTISLQLDHVVDAPQFRLMKGDKGLDDWKTVGRHAPGLWADIIGEFFRITMPTTSIKDMEDPSEVMRLWDSIVRLYHDLRGTDVTKMRRQWVVADEQISAGYMHAGYPICTHLDVVDPKNKSFIFNYDDIKANGRWGLFHEIGHNMQRPEWTFDGVKEVTVNIFTLYAMETVCHLKPWIHSWLANNLKAAEEYLKGDTNFAKWKKSPGFALFVYAQLVHEFGWDSYKKVFRRYEAMTPNEKPKDNQQKMDAWFTQFSEVVGFNLAPLAMFWSIPISDEAVEKLGKSFPNCFLPDDEVTKLAEDRVDALVRKFPGIVRKK